MRPPQVPLLVVAVVTCLLLATEVQCQGVRLVVSRGSGSDEQNNITLKCEKNKQTRSALFYRNRSDGAHKIRDDLSTKVLLNINRSTEGSFFCRVDGLEMEQSQTADIVGGCAVVIYTPPLCVCVRARVCVCVCLADALFQRSVLENELVIVLLMMPTYYD